MGSDPSGHTRGPLGGRESQSSEAPRIVREALFVEHALCYGADGTLRHGGAVTVAVG